MVDIERKKLLTHEWAKVKEQLINIYRPDKIILFGSLPDGLLNELDARNATQWAEEIYSLINVKLEPKNSSDTTP